MAINETSGFVRPNRAGLWQLAVAVFTASASSLAKALRRRRRAPPIEHLSAYMRRDIGLDRY